MCSLECPFRKVKPGILTQGYFPSSPVYPRYVIDDDIFEFYQLLKMPKLGFTKAMQYFFESRPPPVEVLAHFGCKSPKDVNVSYFMEIL
jgi:hypothetical protein